MKSAILSLIAASTVSGAWAGNWELTIGPAWRARAKTTISAEPGQASSMFSYDRNPADHAGDWRADEVVRVPDALTPGEELYAATAVGTTKSSVPASAADDVSRPLGLKADLGCTVFAWKRLSVALNLHLAGYWRLRSSAAGGHTRISQVKDYWLFEDGPYPDDTDFSSFKPAADPDLAYREDLGSYVTKTPSLRVRGDLYQIGFGPKLAFAATDFLSVYGGVEALCNLAYLDCRAGDAQESEVRCLGGFGVRLGANLGLTEHLGLYGEAGYERIDEAEASVDGRRARVDYSGLVVSAGFVLRF